MGWYPETTAAPAFLGASTNASGSVTGPTAGQTIASLTTATAGIYIVNWIVGVAGTTASTEARNFELMQGTTSVFTSLNSATSGQYVVQTEVALSCAAGATLSVQAVAAGTSTAIYYAEISAAPVS